MVREGHTRPRGPSESPDGVDPNIRRTIKTQRDGHNSGVKIWSLCSVSSTLSHASIEQPFQTLTNKVSGKYNCKEVFLCLFMSCVSLLLRASFYSCVCYHCVGMYPVYICMQQRLLGWVLSVAVLIIATTKTHHLTVFKSFVWLRKRWTSTNEF